VEKTEPALKLNRIPCKWSIAWQIREDNVPLQIMPAGSYSREDGRRKDVRNIGFSL